MEQLQHHMEWMAERTCARICLTDVSYQLNICLTSGTKQSQMNWMLNQTSHSMLDGICLISSRTKSMQMATNQSSILMVALQGGRRDFFQQVAMDQWSESVKEMVAALNLAWSTYVSKVQV